MIPLPEYNPDRSLPAKIRRRVTQWRPAQRLTAAPKRPIVTFTFDDFPKSAADTGAEIVEAAGGKATYYACTGMAGSVNATGELFDETDLAALAKAGHEIGAHTDSHIDCAKAFRAEILANVEANLARLKEMGHDTPVTQFAYPYGETRLDVKRAMTVKFQACRGILAGVNGEGSDLMQLRAMELEPGDWTTDRAAAAIEAAARKPAWVVIFTHDVRETPSDYGTTPDALISLARKAKDSGAAILTMSEALAEIQGAQDVAHTNA